METMLKLIGISSGNIQKISSLTLDFSNSFAAFLLVMIFLLPTTAALYKFEGKPVTPKKKNILRAIRYIFITLVAFFAAGPVLNVSGTVPEKNKIAVMLDTSSSMNIPSTDSDGSKTTRLENMKSCLSKGFLADLEAKTSVKPDFFIFSETAETPSLKSIRAMDFEANGKQTNISGAIGHGLGTLGSSGLLGIVIMTDGTKTTGRSIINEAAGIKTPLYFITPSEEDKLTDLGISLNTVPSVGYLNSGLRVTGRISAFGDIPLETKIKVSCNGEQYTEITVDSNKDSDKTFSLNIPLNKEGNFRYDFQIPTLANELTTDNNSSGFIIKVVKESLKVTAISGCLDWDIKFLGNAAVTDPNTEFTYFCKVLPERWAASKDMKPLKGSSNPDITKSINEADVLVLSQVKFDDIKPYSQLIKERTMRGSLGLLIFAGDKSFTELGYKNTDLGQMLPVKITKEENIRRGGSLIIPKGNTDYSFLKITEDPKENSEFFANLPKINGVSHYSEIKPGSEVLLNTSIKSKDEHIPFMIKSRYGSGNVILIAGGPIWQTGFKLVPTDYGMTPYTAITLNMLKLLANRREDARVSIELSSSKGESGKAQDMKILVSDKNHKMLSNAEIKVTIKSEKDGKTEIPCIETSEPGFYESSFIPSYNGVYKIEAEASYRGRIIGKAENEILIEPPTAEFDDPNISFEEMQKSAEITNGICVSWKDTDQILNRITNTPGEKTAVKAIDLRESWVLLLIMLLLPCLEWYIRRTGGLS